MIDILVIGSGPAGISAAIYAKRAGKEVKVFYSGKSQLELAHKIDNYYGFIDGISGTNLYNNGINQAKNLGIEVVKKEIIDIKILPNKGFIVKSSEEEFETKTVIIATGNKKLKPNIEGINSFEGRGISYCAICDGFFYRNKNLVVIGNGKYAVSEANDLKDIASNVKILTDGKVMEEDSSFEVITKKIKEIKGNQKVEKIVFDDNSIMDVDGIFIAIGQAGGLDFAKKIGIMTENNSIKVNENMETNVKGIYSAGNLTGGLLQVNKATYEGAKAGLSAVAYINSLK